MKKVLLLILLVLILGSVDIIAEEYNRGLGFTAGRISGVGFTYRQYMEKNGIQFTFGMLSDRDKKPSFPELSDESITLTGWKVIGSLSFMYLRTLRKSERTRFYWFAGASMDIDYRKRYTQNYNNSGNQLGSPSDKGFSDNNYYFGPGVGLDFQVSKYVSFMIELPISISSDKKIETYIPQGGILVRF